MRKIIRRGEKTRDLAKCVKKEMLTRRQLHHPVEFLNSGCTTLNLSLSGQGKHGGWGRGRIFNIVGDGSSGKTLLALEVAFCFFNRIQRIKSQIFPQVKKFTICYCNVEGVMDFPIQQMYGKKFYKFVNWKTIRTIEEMSRDYTNKLRSLKKGEALLYIIDSWDALRSIADKERFEKSLKENKEIEGSYNLEKQKYASAFFANICGDLEDNKVDATLCIISQVRTRIGITFGKKTYRAGGKSLDFYTHQVAWIREIEKLSKTKKGEKRVYGIRSEVKVERSKVAKPFRSSSFDIIFDYGLDDISSMIHYLWGKKTIKFRGHIFKDREKFIKFIEGNNLEDELTDKTERKWNRVEDAFTKDVKTRKSKY